MALAVICSFLATLVLSVSPIQKQSFTVENFIETSNMRLCLRKPCGDDWARTFLTVKWFILDYLKFLSPHFIKLQRATMRQFNIFH